MHSASADRSPRLHPFAFPKDHPLGQTLAVTCIASQGSQPLDFVWLKDGRPLPVGGQKVVSKMITESVSVLTVFSVGAEDVGNYTCQASNHLGSDASTAELIVAGMFLKYFLSVISIYRAVLGLRFSEG